MSPKGLGILFNVHHQKLLGKTGPSSSLFWRRTYKGLISLMVTLEVKKLQFCWYAFPAKTEDLNEGISTTAANRNTPDLASQSMEKFLISIHTKAFSPLCYFSCFLLGFFIFQTLSPACSKISHSVTGEFDLERKACLSTSAEDCVSHADC